MNSEHEILSMVTAAKGDALAADELVRRYLPVIRSETARHLRRPAREDDCDDDPGDDDDQE